MIGTQPEATYGEAIVAWRIWRIDSWTTLTGAQEPRLMALTAGQSWPTRQPLEAQCASTFGGGMHDAPEPRHNCGVWALRSREQALHVAGIARTEGLDDWAIGRVSLWGRVIEHRDGYRAQYAYPYDLVVHARSEATARRLRDLYAVDVEWEERLKTQAPEEAEEELIRLEEIEFSEEELLLAVFAAHYRYGCQWENVTTERDVVEALLQTRGQLDRHVYKQEREHVTTLLSSLDSRGLIESGELPSYKVPHVRFTERGLSRLAEIGIPATTTVSHHGYRARLEVVSTERAFDALTKPSPLFTWEIERDKPAWISERQAAQAKGREFYVRWLRQWRKDSHKMNRLFFEESEILEALAEAVRVNGGKPVPFEGLIEQLAPGVPSHFEASWFSSRLVKLRKDGLVETTGNRTKLWQPSSVALHKEAA